MDKTRDDYLLFIPMHFRFFGLNTVLCTVDFLETPGMCTNIDLENRPCQDRKVVFQSPTHGSSVGSNSPMNNTQLQPKTLVFCCKSQIGYHYTIAPGDLGDGDGLTAADRLKYTEAFNIFDKHQHLGR